MLTYFLRGSQFSPILIKKRLMRIKKTKMQVQLSLRLQLFNRQEKFLQMKQVYSTFWLFKIMKQWCSETASILLKIWTSYIFQGKWFYWKQDILVPHTTLNPKIWKKKKKWPKGPDRWSWQKCHTMFFKLQHPLNMHITIRKDDTIN